MVLTIFTLGPCGGLDWFSSIFTLRWCGGLERTDFYNFYIGRVWWSRNDWLFIKFLLWEGVVVLKGLVYNNFTFGECGGLKRTDLFYNFYLGRVWWQWKDWFSVSFMLRVSSSL